MTQQVPSNQRALQDALRELPEVAPPADVWVEIERRVHRGARPDRGQWWFAAAAGAVLAITAGVWLTGPSADTDAVSGIPALVAQSQQLERRVARHHTQPQASEWSASRRALVYRIADLDRELAPLSMDPAQDPTRAEALWRQRVALMQSLAEIDRTDSPRRLLAL